MVKKIILIETKKYIKLIQKNGKLIIKNNKCAEATEFIKKINDFFINNKDAWSIDDYNKTIDMGGALDIKKIKSTFLYLVTESTIHNEVIFFSEKMIVNSNNFYFCY